MKRMLIPDEVRECMRILEQAGYEVYIVGGAVRDFLCGRPIHDYDLTTNASPAEMQELFRHYQTNTQGLKHGTLGVILQGKKTEITTYRQDNSYTDHRHPGNVTFTRSAQEDCARRDFTINAMIYHPDTGIQDFFGGIQDLDARIIRTVGDPAQRFEEDALRIMRAIRFSAELGFTIEPATETAIFQKKEDLRYIAAERLQEELIRILKAPYGTGVIFRYLPVLQVFLPEIVSVPEAVRALPAVAEMRMAALLSAVPETSVHEILTRMRFSREFCVHTGEMIRSLDMPLKNRTDIKHMLNRMRTPFGDLLTFKSAFDPTIQTSRLMSIYGDIQNMGDCYRLKDLKINGEEMIRIGFRSQEIGKVLQTLLEQVIEGKLPNEKTSLTAYAEDLFRSADKQL